MTRALEKPFCVALNRFDLGDDKTVTYCREENIPIVLSIADDRRIAEAYARGEILIEALPSYAPVFTDAWERILAWYESQISKKQIPVLLNQGKAATS